MPKKRFFFPEQWLLGRFFYVACSTRLPLGLRTAALGLGLTLGWVFSLLVLKPSGSAWCQLTLHCASLCRGCYTKWRMQLSLFRLSHRHQGLALPSHHPERPKHLGGLSQHCPCCQPIPVPQTLPAPLCTARMHCSAALGGVAGLLAEGHKYPRSTCARRRRTSHTWLRIACACLRTLLPAHVRPHQQHARTRLCACS